jgi:hypothetical protein
MMRLSIRGANEELLVVNRRMLGGLVCTWPAISRREIIGGDASRGLIARDPSGNKLQREPRRPA